jgi:hypothetical protein
VPLFTHDMADFKVKKGDTGPENTALGILMEDN